MDSIYFDAAVGGTGVAFHFRKLTSPISHLSATFGVLVVPWKDFKRDWNPVSSTIGTEGIPNCTMYSIIYYIQTSQSHKGHGSTT